MTDRLLLLVDPPPDPARPGLTRPDLIAAHRGLFRWVSVQRPRARFVLVDTHGHTGNLAYPEASTSLLSLWKGKRGGWLLGYSKRGGWPVASRTDIHRSPAGSTWLRWLIASGIGMWMNRRRQRPTTISVRPDIAACTAAWASRIV